MSLREKVPLFRPASPPLTRGAVLRLRPGAATGIVDSLATIWDEVVHNIIREALALDPETTELHINIKGEMIEEIAQLTHWLGDRVVERRLGGRVVEEIEPAIERNECLAEAGAEAISATARMVFDHIWSPRMKERWGPKSAKALERDANPRPNPLVVKPVDKNHFIPKSFLRNYWAEDGWLRRWRKSETGWTVKRIPFGAWGHRPNLYSDRTEAYFGLIEGDVAGPLKKLLQTSPLNDPERSAFVGFLIIQLLRSPFLVEALGDVAENTAAEIGHVDPDIGKKAYDTLFTQNSLYDRLARPVMWSQWALVKSEAPSFVVPDSFAVRGDLGEGMRLIVPLTPRICFVTLAESEAEKRVVPITIKADVELARAMSHLLVGAAVEEFVAHSELEPAPAKGVAFADVLGRLTEAARDAM